MSCINVCLSGDFFSYLFMIFRAKWVYFVLRQILRQTDSYEFAFNNRQTRQNAREKDKKRKTNEIPILNGTRKKKRSLHALTS